MVALLCNQRRSKGSHDARDIRADSPAARDFLKASKHCVIVKGTALNHYMTAEIRGICDLDNLKQRIFNDRISQTCGDICYGSPFLLPGEIHHAVV